MNREQELQTPKPMHGIWTLTAPDGRQWTALTPLACAAAESRERIPATVALARIYAAADEPTELETELIAALRWAYSKLHHINFTRQDDALMLDRFKLLLEHGVPA